MPQIDHPERELLCGGPESYTGLPTMYCPGCHYGTVARVICEAIDELGIKKQAIGVAGVGCHGFMIGTIATDFVFALHGRGPGVATGIKRSQSGKPIVFTIQGDGDLAAIGMGDIINAIGRGEKLTTIFCNNAGYGTTGGQMAPTTLLEQVTTTTPTGRDPQVAGYPIHVAEMLAILRGTAYSARGALTSRKNYNQTKKFLNLALQKQMDGIGYGFVEILSACPSTLHMPPNKALKWVEEYMIAEYPLGEFKNVKEIL